MFLLCAHSLVRKSFWSSAESIASPQFQCLFIKLASPESLRWIWQGYRIGYSCIIKVMHRIHVRIVIPFHYAYIPTYPAYWIWLKLVSEPNGLTCNTYILPYMLNQIVGTARTPNLTLLISSGLLHNLVDYPILLQCKVCMQTFMCTTTEVKCREHAEAKHPKSDPYSCFPHLKK